MKSIGIVRKIDELGRIVIPKELRRTMDIKEGDSLEIYTEHNNIILRKYNPGCGCCGEIQGLKEVNGIRLCKTCIEKFK
ncbi:AbrB/MazE/SpoVT family DNA-binding domain-containing protein [Clostridium chromiireducens]|uniref:AbrB/MazE/SpoVT family DNA-binding domain-containing protein n=1 Tax=Clostridium chromiireducens TaxID=225345 RepID=A0A964RIU4_9CLOT|nr:AbrB/MazE/SpoVT family DNA-binding domain-containing protein [Clostridium chromiireducens]MVX62265.1 AbrB/MazE/SpoVT family DNA-binding domain-containing protein [Clostridium chromiireducens]